MKCRHSKYSYILLGSLLLFAGHFLAYKAYTYIGNSTSPAIIGIIAFLLIIISLIFFISVYAQFYYDLEKNMPAFSVTKRRVLNSAYNIVGILLIVLSIFPYFYYTHRYKFEQLKNYGVQQKIEVEEILSGKGGSRVFFHFNLNDSAIYGELPKGNLTPGDTATIIFSSQNPEMLLWLDDYQK